MEKNLEKISEILNYMESRNSKETIKNQLSHFVPLYWGI
jgi:hypothetical protein